jgi:hypothetical protein
MSSQIPADVAFLAALSAECGRVDSCCGNITSALGPPQKFMWLTLKIRLPAQPMRRTSPLGGASSCCIPRKTCLRQEA